MTTKTNSLTILLVAVSLLAGTPWAAAQSPFDADPFGTGAAAPASAAPSSRGAAPPPKEEEEDPLVQSILNSKPATPIELVRAIEILLDYGRLDVAKTMFDRVNAMTLTPQQLVALHDRFRSGLFIRIGRTEVLKPQGGEFEKRVLEAARKAARNQGRVDALVRQLSDPDPVRRHTAVVDLREAQDVAINGMLRVLADATRAAEHRPVQDGIVTLLTPAAEVRIRNASLPLTEMVVSAAMTSDPALKAQVLSVLGRLSSRQATPFLVRPALAEDTPAPIKQAAQQALRKIIGVLPTHSEAEIYLERRAETYLANQRAAAHQILSQTSVWEWDDTTRTATRRQLDLEHAALLEARNITRELHLLTPESLHYRQLYLATALQTEKKLGGLSTPLGREPGSAFAEAASGGVQAVSDLLEFILRRKQFAGAAGAVEVLGEIGDATLVASADGQPRLMTRMLLHENRRMRFAAAQAILRLDPQGPYPGSSYLAETLAYFARTRGARRVLIAHPRTDAGQFVVGLLRELGIEADTAQTGNQTIKLAHESPDYEFVLISDGIDRPAVAELIQQLRRDSRTRGLPLGVMSRQERARQMEHLVQTDPLAIAFPRLHSSQAMRIQTRRLLETAGRNRLGTDERMLHAEFALQELARLATDPDRYAFYDLVRYEASIHNALANSFLADQAASVLGELATPEAQRALLAVSNQQARPLLDRQAAAKAFEASVQRRGILLTRGEILAQYDRYNASADADVETQKVLGSILDAIEAPTQTKPDADSGVVTES